MTGSPGPHPSRALVDLTGCPGAAAGDKVVLLGAQDGHQLSHEGVARAWGISVTEPSCAVRNHILRFSFGPGPAVEIRPAPQAPD